MNKKRFFTACIFTISLCPIFGATKQEVVKATQDARDASDKTCEVLNGKLSTNLSSIINILYSIRPKIESTSKDLSGKSKSMADLKLRLEELSRKYNVFKADFERDMAYLEEKNNLVKNAAEFLPNGEAQIKRGNELAKHLESFTPNLSPAELVSFKKYVKESIAKFNFAERDFNNSKADLLYEIERVDIANPLIAGMKNNSSSVEEFLKRAKNSLDNTGKVLDSLAGKSEELNKFFLDVGKSITKECSRFSDLISKANAEKFALMKFCNDVLLTKEDFLDVYFNLSKYSSIFPISVRGELLGLPSYDADLALGYSPVLKAKSASADYTLSARAERSGINTVSSSKGSSPEFEKIIECENLSKISGELRNMAQDMRNLCADLRGRYSYYESAQKKNLSYLQEAIALYTSSEMLGGETQVLSSSIEIISEQNKSDKSAFEKFSKEFNSAAKEAEELIKAQKKALEDAKTAFGEYKK